jgi:polygalacturonase
VHNTLLSRGEKDAVLPAGVGNKSISLKNCRNVTLRDISILHGGHFAFENAYPEPNLFGALPAQGFFIRHVKGMAMCDVEIRSATADLRPAFVLDDVDGADSSRIKLPKGCSPAWVLKNVRDLNLAQSRPFPDTYLESVTQKSL